jgi:hypothetical protein
MKHEVNVILSNAKDPLMQSAMDSIAKCYSRINGSYRLRLQDDRLQSDRSNRIQ